MATGMPKTRGAGAAAKSLNIKAIKKGVIQNRCRKSKVSSSPAPKLQDSSAPLWRIGRKLARYIVLVGIWNPA
jgi:hypothetical protein